ncbi:MAG: HAMP domain-containing histidine kinase [Planctomycetota bacterium]|nr:MAG: HAMP domain-containing histidine kinase [Planctomycetota bacterium]
MKLPVWSSISAEFKIFILIILALVVPSLLLSIASMNALGNVQERSRRQLRERYERLTGDVAREVMRRFREEIDGARRLIDQAVGPGSEVAKAESVFKTYLDGKVLFANLFIFNSNASLIYPRIPHANARGINGEEDIEDKEPIFENAKYYEYERKAYARAKMEYERIAGTASDPKIRAYAFLAAGRCAGKAGLVDEAKKFYEIIVRDYPGHRDAEGFYYGLAARYRISELAADEGPYSRAGKLLDTLEFLLDEQHVIDREQYYYFESRVLMELEDIEITDKDKLESFQTRLSKLLARRKVLARAAEFGLEFRNLFDDVIQRYINAPGRRLRFERIGKSKTKTENRLFAYITISGPAGGAVGFEIVPKNFLEAIVRPARNKVLEEENLPADSQITLTEGGKSLFPDEDFSKFYRLYDVQLGEPLENLWAVAFLRDVSVLSRLTSETRIWVIIASAIALLIGVYFTSRTVSKQMKIARLQSDFVSNVTHELKTPLTSIQMFVETLQMGRVRDEEEEKECLDIISSETLRLSRLIDRVLTFARVERGMREFHFRWAWVEDIIRETIAVFKTQVKHERIQMNVQIDPKLPKLWVDPDAVREVLLNLFSNAVKYSKDEKRIQVVARQGVKYVYIDVRDFGIGISKWERKQIFEKFYRSDSRLAREVEGTGLGLTISLQIAKTHGGDIKVVSHKGRGSTFALILPKKPPAREHSSAEKAKGDTDDPAPPHGPGPKKE